MNFPAEYAEQTRRCGRIGLLSLLLGVLSGPLAITAALYAGGDSLLANILFSAVLVTIAVLQIASLVYIWRWKVPVKGRRRAVVGLVASCLWFAVIAVLSYKEASPSS